jgi:predicted dehydrogenase
MQLGVIGLGRHWRQRYKPALRALRDRLAVRLVCDQVYQRARHEARQLCCAAALGPTELLQCDAVEAVLLPDAQWFGLWPLELACGLGKPVLCGDDLLPDEPDLERLRQLVQASGLPVMVGMPPRHAPVTGALLDLLAGRLGPARAVACDFFQTPGPGLPLALLDWCALALDAQPVSVLAAGPDAGGLTSVYLEFPDGRHAQLTGWSGPEAWHAPRLHVHAERGWASVELPGRLRWADVEGRHATTLRGQPQAEAMLLDRFGDALRSGQPPQPGLADAGRLLAWLRAAERSRAEGRRVTID